MHSALVLRLLGLSALAIGGCADRPATSIVLALRNNEVAASIDHVEVHVFRPSESAPKFDRCIPAAACAGAAGAAGMAGAAGTAGTAGTAELPGTLALYPESLEDLTTPVLVVLEGKVGGVTKVSRRARMAFVKEKSKLLRLELSAACLDVDCSQSATGRADQTCVEGACTGIDLDPDTQPDFSTPGEALDPIQFKQNPGAAGQGGSAGTAGEGGAGGSGAGGAGQAGAGQGGAGMAGAGMAGGGGAGMGGAGMGGAGMAGAGTAGAGMAGVGGMDPCMPLPTVQLTIQQLAGSTPVSGAALTYTIQVNGGHAPYKWNIEQEGMPHPYSTGGPDFSDLPFVHGGAIELCGSVSIRARITDAMCGDIFSNMITEEVAPDGPYVAPSTIQEMKCGSKNYPKTSIAEAVKTVDKSIWDSVFVAAGSYSEPTSILMRDGISVLGGFSLAFPPTATPFLAADPTAIALTLVSTTDASPVFIWPPLTPDPMPHAVTATLADLQVVPVGDTPVGVQVSPGAHALLQRVRVDPKATPGQADLPPQGSFTGLLVIPDKSDGPGDLTLEDCAITTPLTECQGNTLTCAAKALSVSSPGTFGVTLTGGTFTARDTKGTGTYRESVGVEVALEKGLLKVTGATIEAGSTSGSTSIGLRMLSGQGATIMGGVVTTTKANSSLVADAIRLGIDPAEKMGPTSLSLGATFPLTGTYGLQGVDSMTPAIFHVPEVQANGTGRAVAFFGGAQPASLVVGDCQLLGPTSVASLATDAFGLFADGSLSPAGVMSAVTLDAQSFLVGGWAAKRQIGAQVAGMSLLATGAFFRGSPTSLPSGAPFSGEQSKGLVLEGASPASITGGVAYGGILTTTGVAPAMPPATEVIGIEVNTSREFSVTNAALTGCDPGVSCKGFGPGDRAAGVRLLGAVEPMIKGCSLVGGDLASPLVASNLHALSAGVVIEPDTGALGVQGTVHVEDNHSIVGGKAIVSYGVVEVSLLPPGWNAPPTASILRNFVAPGGTNALNDSQLCKIGCRSIGLDLLAAPDSLVVDNIVLGGVSEYTSALHLATDSFDQSVLVAHNLFASQINGGGSYSGGACPLPGGSYSKIANLEGSNMKASAEVHFVGNVIVPYGDASATPLGSVEIAAMSNQFLQSSKPSLVFPQRNQIVHESPSVTIHDHVCWYASTCCQEEPPDQSLDVASNGLLLDPKDELLSFVAKLVTIPPGPVLPPMNSYTSTCQQFLRTDNLSPTTDISATHVGWSKAMAVDFLNNPRTDPTHPTIGPLECP